MRFVFAVLSLSAVLAAQTIDQAGLVRLTQELRSAIQNDSLGSAADIAAKFDDAVQAQRRTWLVRDSSDRAEEVLSWLPADIESFWVNQNPILIDGNPSARLQDPTQIYSLDRLIALNGGAFYHGLANRTVRLVVAATRAIQAPDFNRGLAIPGAMNSSQDTAYFYFFTTPLDLPPPDESIQGRPAWQGLAKISTGERVRPPAQPPQRDDLNWIVQARPDLLILANRKELLSGLLDHVLHGSKTRALPADLPEWTQVDRSASFWGLRHYSSQSKPKSGERGCEQAEPPFPDCHSTGVTVLLDTAKQHLEVRYMSPSKLAERGMFGDAARNQFLVNQPQIGIWRFASNIAERGDYPMHFAMLMLGFGMYR
jgi:hypothetical protein